MMIEFMCEMQKLMSVLVDVMNMFADEFMKNIVFACADLFCFCCLSDFLYQFFWHSQFSLRLKYYTVFSVLLSHPK